MYSPEPSEWFHREFEPITNKFEKNGVFANETGLNAMGEGTSRAHAFRTDTEESAEQ
jgi:hypothetical protein